MNPREFLDLCIKNKKVKNSVIVYYNGIIYHPIRIVVWVDDDFSVQNSAVLESPLAKSTIQVPIKDVHLEK